VPGHFFFGPGSFEARPGVDPPSFVRLSGELVNRRLDDADGPFSPVDHPMKLFHGLRREMLFTRLDIDASRHVLDEEETAIYFQGICDSPFDERFRPVVLMHHCAPHILVLKSIHASGVGS
jgi:hypothetical protein